MSEHNIMEKLGAFVPSSNDMLLNVTLRLLLNLSFDQDIRVRALPHAPLLASAAQLTATALRSIDGRARAHTAVETSPKEGPQALLRLLPSVQHSERACTQEQMVKCGFIPKLVDLLRKPMFQQALSPCLPVLANTQDTQAHAHDDPVVRA
jgi:hypothetical protein